MARAGLDKNKKFMRLARQLNSVAAGMGELLARGALETMWSAAYERADDHLGGAEDVELTVKWQGPPGLLVQALVSAGGDGEAGFIEADAERGGYRVHDLWDHAPPWVKRKAAAEAERRAAGKTLSDVRREAGKRGNAAARGIHAGQGEQTATGSGDLPGKSRPDAGKPTAKVSPGTGEGEGRERDGRKPDIARARVVAAGDVEREWDARRHLPIHTTALAPVARDVNAYAKARKVDAGELLGRVIDAFPAYREWVNRPGIRWNLADSLAAIVGKNGGGDPSAPTTHVGRLVEWVLDGKKPEPKDGSPAASREPPSPSRYKTAAETAQERAAALGPPAERPPPEAFAALRKVVRSDDGDD